MRRSLERTEGFAVVIAIVAMALILTLGLAILAYVDGAQQRSGTERVSETSYNLAEAALDSEVMRLSNVWPTSAALAYPTTCTRSSALVGCPDAATMAQVFTGTDFNNSATWTVTVRDDLGAAATYYSQSVLDSTACGTMVPCTWDSNGNGTLWVRAQATIGTATRTAVAQVKLQQLRVPVPRNVVTAGKFSISNNGLKPIIDEKGCQASNKPASNCNANQPAPVAVRCTTTTPGTAGDPCLGYRSTQVSPNVYQQGYSGNVISPTQLNQMRTYAKQLGTYYTSCPSTAAASGPMVFIEGVSCSYNGGSINSAAHPGVLVINQGTLSLGGNTNFYGLIYAADNLPSPTDAGTLVSLSGSAYVQGSIIVDGNGGVVAGSSGLNVSFDPNALNVIASSGTAAIAQGSFRELLAGQ